MGVMLPSEYQQVEYLESTGTQYIDTGINLASNNFEISCRFVNTMRTGAVEQSIFSIWVSRYNYWNCCIPSDRHLSIYTAAHHKTEQIINVGDLYDIVLSRESNGWSVVLNNETVTWNYSPSSPNETSLKLFRRGDIPVLSSSNTYAKIYLVSVKINNELVADYVPCYRKSDNKPGMYDLVSGTFFVNQDTGEDFIVGPDVIDSISPWLVARRRALMMWKKTRLPSEYQEVEYLETSQTGAPYIDSGVAITEDLVFEIDFQLTNSGRAKYFMGTYNGYAFYLYLSGDSTPYFQTAFGSAWANTTLLADTQRHKFVYQFENEKLVVRDSNTTILTKPKAGFPVRSILVAGTSETQNKTPCRTYESKMIKSGVVIQDLIPCYRKADDTPGMYDLVSNTFFTNAGTGGFIVGADIN